MWYPESSSNTNSAAVSIQNRDGVANVSQNLRLLGGRWNKLADVNFLEGQGYSITISNGAASAGILAVNALKITAWPSCGKIPGSVCLSSP
jgi:hypothetical protein